MNTDWLKELALLRKDLEKASENVEKCQEELEQTYPWQALQTYKEKQAGIKKDIDEVTNHIKDEVLAEYSGEDTKPYDGVQIKTFTIVEVKDEKKAKIWAAQNAPSLISISKSKFDKAVKELELDFIEIGEEYRVYLASDLSAYLEE